MTEPKHRKVCPRLIDYLCLVGTRNCSNNGGHSSVHKPELLRRYPPDDHKDFPLPREVANFCQPEGCMSIGPKKTALKDTTAFIFTLTDKDSGLTRYGMCLNFYRPSESCPNVNRSSVGHFGRKDDDGWRWSGDKSSDSAFSSDYRSSVSQMAPSDSDPDQHPSIVSTVGSRNGRHRRHRQRMSNQRKESDDNESPSPSRNHSTRRKEGKPCRLFTLTSLCLITHHPFISNLRECLVTLRQLIDACEEASSPKRVGASRTNANRHSIWSLLVGPCQEHGYSTTESSSSPGLAPPSIPSSLALHDVREIETWIFRLLSAPVPVAGLTRIEMEILPKKQVPRPPLIFALPDHTRFSMCDFPLHLPLELLGVGSCLQVLTLILLEKKVVVQSRDYSALTLSVISLTKLLYPLEYMFPVIPLLPATMSGSEQIMLSPTPYIIGVPTSFLLCKRNNFQLPDDVWLVDLDANQITPPLGLSLGDIPPLPEPEARILKTHLKQSLASMSFQPIKNFDDLPPESLQRLATATQDKDPMTPSICGYNPFIYGNDVDSVDVATRVAMVRFFNSRNLLANFNDHCRTLRLYPRPVVAFQINSFLRSRAKISSFTTQFASTQAVEYFAEWALMPTNLAFQRIHTGVFDPTVIGDKAKWYAHNLECIRFQVWDDQSTLGRALIKLREQDQLATDESGSDSEAGSTSSSCSSLSDLVSELVTSNDYHATSKHVEPRSDVLPSGLDLTSVYHPPSALQIPGAAHEEEESESGNAQTLSEDSSPSEQEEVDVPETRFIDNQDEEKNGEDVFTSESENSVATTKTMRCLDPPGGGATVGGASGANGGPGGVHRSSSPSFGSDLSIAGSMCSEVAGGASTPRRNHISSRQSNLGGRASSLGSIASLGTGGRGGASIFDQLASQAKELVRENHSSGFLSDVSKFKLSRSPRSKMSDSTSSSGSFLDQDEEEFDVIRQSSTEDVAQELFHNIEQFTQQAKKAADSAAESFETAGKNALKAAGMRKDTLEDLQYVSKNVVDDISTKARSKKRDFLRALGESMTDEQATADATADPPDTQSGFLSTSRRSSRDLIRSISRDIIPTSYGRQVSSPVPRVGTPVGTSTYTRQSSAPTVWRGGSGRGSPGGVLGSPASPQRPTHVTSPGGGSAVAGGGTGSVGGGSSASPSPSLHQSSFESNPPKSPHIVPAPSPPHEAPHEGLSRSSSNLSTMTQSTQEFLSSFGSDLATQTSNLFGDLFGTRSSPVSTPRSPNPHVHHRERPFGPFPRGRRGLAEKSSLIRHPSSREKAAEILRYQQPTNENKSAITAENHAFIKDVVDQVFAGDGVGWLKLNRLKKLMEDETYRNLTLGRLNKVAERKIGPDDHVDDVCLEKNIWKGVLKIILAIIHGLEIAVSNNGIGGVSSAFQALEVAHTHYWSKEISGGSNYGATPSVTSNASSPFGSRENLSMTSASPRHSLQSTPVPDHTDPGLLQKRPSHMDLGGKLYHDNLVSPTGPGTESDSDILKGLLNQKKAQLRNRMASVESQASTTCGITIMGSSEDAGEQSDTQSIACSETGSFITNPSFQLQRSALTRFGVHASMRSVMSEGDLETGNLTLQPKVPATDMVWQSKSSLSSGYRFHRGSILQTGSSPSPETCGRTYIFEGILNQMGGGMTRRGSMHTNLWENMAFWEDIFLDAVAQERDLIGMDTGAGEMMERYRALSDCERKRLEHDEDRLLSTMLFNLTAFMVMMQVPKQEIKRKIRRLLGKSHIGLIYSQEINQLLDEVANLNGNDIDLKPLPSRQMNRQSFTVHAGTDESGDLLFMEVREDGLILRSVNGAIAERWFFERLVNMTFSPKNKVICLWRRTGGQTQLHKYHTKKCKDLYYCIKEAMERAAARGPGLVGPGLELGGEFPVEDLHTGEGGLLQVCMEGVGLLFANSKFFVRLDHIRKCFTQKGGVFVLEEFNPKSRQVIQRRYSSSMADQICYSVLCVFSYVAAGQKQKRPQSLSTGNTPRPVKR